jgi:hypothetical protein
VRARERVRTTVEAADLADDVDAPRENLRVVITLALSPATDSIE